MSRSFAALVASAVASWCVHALADEAAAAPQKEAVEEVVVTGSVLDETRGVGAGSAVTGDEVALVRATHPSEIFVQFPGVWISRNSEEEHLTAIRSPVFAGPSSCGEFQVLENGIPIRPEGFCNANDLFEIDLEQADRIEVLRGAGGALFGGNAVHGVINAVTGAVDANAPWRLSLEGGPYDWGQARIDGGFAVGEQAFSIALLGTTVDGYRDATGHDEQKGVFAQAGDVLGFSVHSVLSVTNLNQETGGYVIGYKAYEDPHLRKSNPNPEAFRDAWSLRFESDWQKTLDSGVTLDVTPYWRRSGMRFLQHFLPGEPLEVNDQTSAGVQAALSGGESWQWRAGVVAEWADGDLYEFQQEPAVGTPFIVATRPVGAHYDYTVTSVMGAAFYDVRVPLADDVDLVQGGRAEWLKYDYVNHMLDGNTKDDGTPCGFGGCLYTRPADRDDDFSNVAGRIGIEWSPVDEFKGYLLAGTGFRPPQATDLYRLQSGQTVADLNSEKIVSLEAGGRGAVGALAYDVAVFGERSKDLLLRDSEGNNVNIGEIDSRGTEVDLTAQLTSNQQLHVALTYVRHEYGFNGVLSGGEQIDKGDDVDTAPRWIGSLQWHLAPTPALESEVEIVYMGEYYVDSTDQHAYPGHKVVNWRGSWRATRDVRLFARVVNMMNEKYADRADFAFGNYRYFPAMPRQIYGGVELSLGGSR